LKPRDATSCEVSLETGWGETTGTSDAIGISARPSSRISVGVIVHNEDKNIMNLLHSISAQRTTGLVIDEIIVVSSGSDDRTDRLVEEYMNHDRRVRLVVQDKPEGKASGINEFLKTSKSEIVVVSSGDVIFDEETLQNLVSTLVRDRRVGLTSVRPVPTNDPNTFMGTVAGIHWRLHYLLKRHGETIAFRRTLVNQMPDGVSADEAYVEAIVRKHSFRTTQVVDSLVFNKGSESIMEFLTQIRRHYAGHLFIKNSYSYAVSSMTMTGLSRVAVELFQCLRRNPRLAHHIIAYVFLEATGRLLGIWDFYARKEHYRKWSAAKTTKILEKNSIALSAT
jgi:glycosyltransferase involved in cell wall biosynthesis